MNNIRANAKSKTGGFTTFSKRGVIILLFTILICTILFFKVLPFLFEKDQDNATVEGAVPQVEDYIKKHILKDSESVEIVHWSKLVERTALDMLLYQVGVVYKIKKPNGAFRMESKIFDLDKNKNVMFEMNVLPFDNM
jgi:hypothetical protein